MVRGLVRSMVEGLVRSIARGLVRGMVRGIVRGMVRSMVRGMVRGMVRRMARGMVRCHAAIEGHQSGIVKAKYIFTGLVSRTFIPQNKMVTNIILTGGMPRDCLRPLSDSPHLFLFATPIP